MKNILTKCCYCGKPITIYAPGPEEDKGQFSCNICIPENSAARDNINESMWTEAKEAEKKHGLKLGISGYGKKRLAKEVLEKIMKGVEA